MYDSLRWAESKTTNAIRRTAPSRLGRSDATPAKCKFAQALQRILSARILTTEGQFSYVVCLFVSRGSPNDAQADAAVYSPHKRVQQKATESHARNQFALYVLQLLQDSQGAARDASDGSEGTRSRLDDGRSRHDDRYEQLGIVMPELPKDVNAADWFYGIRFGCHRPRCFFRIQVPRRHSNHFCRFTRGSC
jgi:hypothetical protein